MGFVKEFTASGFALIIGCLSAAYRRSKHSFSSRRKASVYQVRGAGKTGAG